MTDHTKSNDRREWWADFHDDSIAKRIAVAHYHVRIAQDMAYGHFALGKAQQVLLRLMNRLAKTGTHLAPAPERED